MKAMNANIGDPIADMLPASAMRTLFVMTKSPCRTPR